ncbi:DUF58 domain-containing protein [Candidatus Sumerlaeota bacterium]|nr:DUF58 domain-containing protein [Candidatus Sumerlaeota bacterium]
MQNTNLTYTNRNLIEGYARKYDILLPERHKSFLIGELSGKRAGSSIEYQDRRDYVPGDDIRHIDWRAFARTDRLSVKLYREEICPVLDIIVDTSLSMCVTSEKSLRRMDLFYLFYLLGRKINAVTSLFNLGQNLQRLLSPMDITSMSDIRQDTPIPLLKSSGIARKSGIKIIISDFMFPFSPEELIATFRAADRLILIQILSSFEDDPEEGGFVRLVEAENDEYLDIALNKATIDGYRIRLKKLKDDLDRQTRVAQGAYTCIRDLDSLDLMIEKLLRAKVINVK